jgi:hypothetical protein
MKTTATIVRYTLTILFAALASYVTWTATMETMAGYFDPWMVFACLVVCSTVPFVYFGLKYSEKAL